jgi:tight adherence protein B
VLTLTVVLVALAVLLWPRTPAPLAGLTSAGAAAGSGGTVGAGGLRARRRAADDEALVHLLSLVAAPVRAGVPPGQALEAARAASGHGVWDPVLVDLAGQAARGEVLGPVWAQWADRCTSPELAFVGQAWTLSEQTGAPLADALTSAVEVLEERRRSRERLASAVAGPRASMAVLCLLPLSGPVVGLACGIGIRDLYLGSPAATASLLTGVSLAAFALWWSRRIVGRAT